MSRFVSKVPVLLIASSDPAAQFFVRSAVIWMNDLVVIALIFGSLMIKVYKSHAALNMDKVQGAVNGIQRRRSAEHARRMSNEASPDGFLQRRNSGGYRSRRPSLENLDRFNTLVSSNRSSPAIMQKVVDNGNTAPSSIDLESHEESCEESTLEPETPKDARKTRCSNDSCVSEMSLSGFEHSESSDDDHNSGSNDSSRWRTVSKQRILAHTHGDMPMLPVRDQTIVEELEEDGSDEDYSSSTDHDETMSPSQVGPLDIRKDLKPIQAMTSEDRYRASVCSIPPFMPFRSPSSKEEDTCRTESPSSYASIQSMNLSPRSLSTLRREAVHLPSQNEIAPNKPMRLESEYESIDNSRGTQKYERPDIGPSSSTNPHQAPMQPMRFLSEEEEIDSIKEFQIPFYK